MSEDNNKNINGISVAPNGNGNGADVYFAQTNFRNERKSFGIKRNDRRKHMYIIGKTGMGKTTVLENMAIQDIQRGEGIGIVDPHGEFAEKMLKFVPENRVKDVVYFCPHDTDWPMAFNVMEDVGIEQRHLVAAGLMGVFKKIWPDVWSPRMEYILNNAILALLEYPDSTILGINRMLSDKDYRKEVVSKITDPVVKAFWEQEFARYTDRFMTEAGAAIQNKVGQFISNPLIRNIIGQPKSSFDMRKIMDEKKILIMNLSKGRIGEDNSRLIGAMLITKIYLGAMSRVNVSESERPDFYLYVDEFQNFATESFKDILSEARKYRLSLILAHQYIAQMDETVRDAVFGNVGTMVIFRVGAYDAEILEKEFSPDFTAQDIVNLGFASIYLKLMINGVASVPFSALTLPPIPMPERFYVDDIIKYSRQTYASPKEEVEKRIAEWHAPVAKPVVSASSETSTPSFSEKPAPQLFDAVCSGCGTKTQVPFKPDGKRPVYCRDCKAKYLSKENPPSFPQRVPSFRNPPPPSFRIRGAPSFEEGEVVQKSVAPEKISLEELKKNAPAARKQKSGPDLKELKKVLEETLDKTLPKEKLKEENSKTPKQSLRDATGQAEPPAENNDRKTLKPGDSIRF
jgi:CxxC-x17-CxxC domain-containing protein